MRVVCGQLDVEFPPVTLYFDQSGNIFSINAAGSEKLLDLSNGRECSMNWVTKQGELLTEEQYHQYEWEAGVAEP